MNCKFIEKNDIHERYLLNTLSDSEKSEYLLHIKECESCAGNLEHEKNLLSSIRHVGKRGMKSEIARQVADLKNKENKISWEMILKVAAIFFFLVITPALVFYYQSIETPKISETTDFDKLLSQQKDIEIVEVDEDIETSTKVVEKIKIEVKETPSELLKSVSGAGGAPSVQPIGMAKPVKKSISRVEKSADLLAEVDIEAEKSLQSEPKVSAHSARMTKSSMVSEGTKAETLLDDDLNQMKQSISRSIPELEKFIKPNFFQALGHEFFKHKNNLGKSDQKMLNPYKIITPQESKKTSKGIYRMPLKDNQIYRLDYNINNEIYWINLVPLYIKEEFYFQKSYPDSFPVLKKLMYSNIITFDFFINEKIRKTDPAEISIYFGGNDLLYLNILNEKFYQINLQSDTTSAKLIQ